MADEKEPAQQGKVVAYKLTQALGNHGEGDVLHLDEKAGDALCKAGMAELAKADEMGGGEEEDTVEAVEDEPVVANSVASKLKDTIEKSAADAIAKALANQSKSNESVPATLKQPIYKSVGDYVRGIYKAKFCGDRTETNRVMAYQQEAAKVWNKMGIQCKAPLGINEGAATSITQTQQGYLVNPEFSADIYVVPHDQPDLLSMGEQRDAASNQYNQRFINESSLANGSIFGGLSMQSGIAEGASFNSSLPAWSNVAFNLQKFGQFVYYTNEMLEDASYPVEQEVNEYAAKTFLYGLNTQAVQGSTIEGALNSPSAISVTKSSNDTSWASTPSTNLTYADLCNIYAAVYPGCKERGAWFIHPSLIAPLLQMTFTFTGSSPAWGITYDAREGLGTGIKIFGRPVYECWAMSAPGAAGDIAFIDFSTFLHYKRPYRVDVSKDIQFATDQIAVRLVRRLDFKSRFRNKITGVNGAQQFSNIVTRTAAGT